MKDNATDVETIDAADVELVRYENGKTLELWRPKTTPVMGFSHPSITVENTSKVSIVVLNSGDQFSMNTVTQEANAGFNPLGGATAGGKREQSQLQQASLQQSTIVVAGNTKTIAFHGAQQKNYVTLGHVRGSDWALFEKDKLMAAGAKIVIKQEPHKDEIIEVVDKSGKEKKLESETNPVATAPDKSVQPTQVIVQVEQVAPQQEAPQQVAPQQVEQPVPQKSPSTISGLPEGVPEGSVRKEDMFWGDSTCCIFIASIIFCFVYGLGLIGIIYLCCNDCKLDKREVYVAPDGKKYTLTGTEIPEGK